MYRLDRRNKIISYGRAHFWFELGGKTYGYCYIRKNACSAFKKLICDTSDVALPKYGCGSHSVLLSLFNGQFHCSL